MPSFMVCSHYGIKYTAFVLVYDKYTAIKQNKNTFEYHYKTKDLQKDRNTKP